MSNDLLFELGSEELPSASVKLLGQALANNIVAALTAANLTYGVVRWFATPRRLAVVICDVQIMQTSQPIVRRGPANSSAVDCNNMPLPALKGFANSCGVAVTDLKKIDTDKGSWWVHEYIKPGIMTKELLPDMLNDAMTALPIAKMMRWGDGDAQFARPVHWVVLMLGQEVVPFEIFGIKASQQSFGHRYHHPQSFEIKSPETYEEQLMQAFVIADFNVRRQLICDQVQDLTLNHNQVAVMPDTLVDEVTSIVEWPHVLRVNFEEQFLDVPPEALIAAMQSHQKCFALRDKHGKLLPQFITIANIDSKNPQQVILGNEKVMRARLSDAAFFFRTDKKHTLSYHIPATTHVVYQQKLGSLADKSQRLQAFMDVFSKILNLDLKESRRAAELSKCDLMTGMVGEFPELQGLMGYYYARHDGETDAVSCALYEQYMPRFASDSLPTSSLGMALSLADRLDTLVGAFVIGQKPTGVKDPFKLRRHALAVVRLLTVMTSSLKLSTLITSMRNIYGASVQESPELMTQLHAFILERLPSFYQSQGIALDIVQAVLACENDSLCDMDRRIHALVDFIKLPEAAFLSSACKRVNNLLNQASGCFEGHVLDVAQLKSPSEKTLFEAILRVEAFVAPLYNVGDYAAILNALASLHKPVDDFFTQVMVMVDDESVRNNRLNLLARLQRILASVADISVIQASV